MHVCSYSETLWVAGISPNKSGSGALQIREAFSIDMLICGRGEKKKKMGHHACPETSRHGHFFGLKNCVSSALNESDGVVVQVCFLLGGDRSPVRTFVPTHFIISRMFSYNTGPAAGLICHAIICVYKDKFHI